MDAAGFTAWVAGYERAWRSPGTDLLATLFAADAEYLMSPYAVPVRGLAAIGRLWEDERDGPDEPFTEMTGTPGHEDSHAERDVKAASSAFTSATRLPAVRFTSAVW